jgi:hypothetical protein
VNTKPSLEKKGDLPPRGPRNADPLTDAAGAHPVEAGIGAAIGGVVTGMAIGAVAGPVTAAVGAAIGALAGGYIGKDVGELIDPTVDDDYLRESFQFRPYVKPGERFEAYQPAYRYGAEIESKYGHVDFEAMDEALEQDWSADAECMPWKDGRAAVKDGYERTREIRTKRSQVDPDSNPR